MEKELTATEALALLAKISTSVLLNELKMRQEVKGKSALEISQMITDALPADREFAEQMIEYRNPEDEDES